MSKSTKRIFPRNLVFIILLIFVTKVNSQITTSFYTNSSNSKFAVGYDFNDNLWMDLRVYSGTDIDNFTPEAVLNYNFLNRDYYETYIGAGVILNNINGVVVPVGIGIKPFESLKNLSFNIEFSPSYEFKYNELLVRGFFGIRYRLE